MFVTDGKNVLLGLLCSLQVVVGWREGSCLFGKPWPQFSGWAALGEERDTFLWGSFSGRNIQSGAERQREAETHLRHAGEDLPEDLQRKAAPMLAQKWQSLLRLPMDGVASQQVDSAALGPALLQGHGEGWTSLTCCLSPTAKFRFTLFKDLSAPVQHFQFYQNLTEEHVVTDMLP